MLCSQKEFNLNPSSLYFIRNMYTTTAISTVFLPSVLHDNLIAAI